MKRTSDVVVDVVVVVVGCISCLNAPARSAPCAPCAPTQGGQANERLSRPQCTMWMWRPFRVGGEAGGWTFSFVRVETLLLLPRRLIKGMDMLCAPLCSMLGIAAQMQPHPATAAQPPDKPCSMRRAAGARMDHCTVWQLRTEGGFACLCARVINECKERLRHV